MIKVASGSKVSISNDLTLTSSSEIDVEIGGVQPGEFGTLAVSVDASLSGELKLNFANDFDPPVSTSFELLTHDNRTGQFDNLTTNLSMGKGVVLDYGEEKLTATIGAALMAAGEPAEEPSATRAIDEHELALVVDAAMARWNEHSPVPPKVLEAVQFQIVDLPGNTLGLAAGDVIWIDINAAGFGWYVGMSEQKSSDASADRMDLLSAVMHELGHLFGLSHEDDLDSVMEDELRPGQRPFEDDLVDAIFAESH